MKFLPFTRPIQSFRENKEYTNFTTSYFKHVDGKLSVECSFRPVYESLWV
jgi:hypothetical protein